MLSAVVSLGLCDKLGFIATSKTFLCFRNKNCYKLDILMIKCLSNLREVFWVLVHMIKSFEWFIITPENIRFFDDFYKMFCNSEKCVRYFWDTLYALLAPCGSNSSCFYCSLLSH